MTMIRKIKRSVARYNMEQQDLHFFGKYAPKETLIRGGYTKKPHRESIQRSFFSRSWRAYL